MNKFFFYFHSIIILISCSEKEIKLFEEISPKESGIDFENNLFFKQDFNIFTYRNYYNGGGVGLGDINNDGLLDIYFTSNLNQNKLYLNKGNFQFEDITETAKVGGTKSWSTGVSIVDINSDGFLDIYVSNSGDIRGDNKQNELFINNGDLTFTEKAKDFGLDDRGYSTHAAFFDYDKDGDLDCYLLNNSYKGGFRIKSIGKDQRPVRDEVGGDGRVGQGVDRRLVDALAEEVADAEEGRDGADLRLGLRRRGEERRVRAAHGAGDQDFDAHCSCGRSCP